MSYQYLHIETYPLHPKYNKKSPEKSIKSFSAVARELMRNPDATPHVSNPLPPVILYGGNAYQAYALALARANASTDAMGRQIRKDAQIVLSGVVSCPINFKEESETTYKKWLTDNVKYLLDKYKGELISVILHEDESHPHIHFICVPKQTKDCKLHIKSIHEPIRAREETEGGRKVKFEAYKRAFRNIQDDYYYNVASKYGFLRDGAKKQRLTRSEYVKRRESAKKLSIVRQDLEGKFEHFKEQKKSIQLEISNIKNAKENLQKQENGIIESKRDLVEITKITKERELRMLCLFKKRKNKDAEVQFYKKQNRSLRAMLNRFKRKLFAYKTKAENSEKKAKGLSAEIARLKERNRQLEQEKMENGLRKIKEDVKSGGVKVENKPENKNKLKPSNYEP